jgi:hypothetical protein
MSITIVHTLPEEEWRRFVEEHPAGNIFHTPEMFQVFSRAKGHQPELWAAIEGGYVGAGGLFDLVQGSAKATRSNRASKNTAQALRDTGVPDSHYCGRVSGRSGATMTIPSFRR